MALAAFYAPSYMPIAEEPVAKVAAKLLQAFPGIAARYNSLALQIAVNNESALPDAEDMWDYPGKERALRTARSAWGKAQDNKDLLRRAETGLLDDYAHSYELREANQLREKMVKEEKSLFEAGDRDQA